MPLWNHYESYRRGLRQVFSLFQAPEPATKNLVSLALLVRDSTTLLSGMYGTGKTQLIHLLHKTFFHDAGRERKELGYVTCTQELTPMDVLFSIDLARLVQGQEVVLPRNIVTARFKFINEAQRANSILHNAFLSLLSEKIVVFRDQVFQSPNFVCFLDANPHDSGSSEIPAAFLDRIDFSLTVPAITPSGMSKLLSTISAHDGMLWGFLADMAEPVLSAQDMEQIWDDVRRIVIGSDVRTIAVLIAAYLQRCCEVDRSLAGPDFALPCNRCSFRADACSKLNTIPGGRFVISLLKMAQARAWLRHSETVDVDDVMFGLPFTLSHRLRVRQEHMKLYPNVGAWIVEEVYRRGIRPKVPRWRQAVLALEAPFDGAREIALNMAKRDLAIAALISDGQYQGVGPGEAA